MPAADELCRPLRRRRSTLQPEASFKPVVGQRGPHVQLPRTSGIAVRGRTATHGRQLRTRGRAGARAEAGVSCLVVPARPRRRAGGAEREGDEAVRNDRAGEHAHLPADAPRRGLPLPDRDAVLLRRAGGHARRVAGREVRRRVRALHGEGARRGARGGARAKPVLQGAAPATVGRRPRRLERRRQRELPPGAQGRGRPRPRRTTARAAPAAGRAVRGEPRPLLRLLAADHPVPGAQHVAAVLRRARQSAGGRVRGRPDSLSRPSPEPTPASRTTRFCHPGSRGTATCACTRTGRTRGAPASSSQGRRERWSSTRPTTPPAARSDRS